MRAAGGWAAAGGAAGGRMWAGGGRYGQEQGVRKPEAATTRSQKTRGKTIKQKKTVSAFGQPKYVLSEGGVAPKVFFFVRVRVWSGRWADFKSYSKTFNNHRRTYIKPPPMGEYASILFWRLQKNRT